METQQLEVLPPTNHRLNFFPQARLRNIAIFYFLTGTTNAWFIAGNWIFYWTRYMTYGQLGLMDATAFAFGLLMEVPSGAVSDLVGKKKTVVAAMFLSALGTLMMAVSNSMNMLWVAFMIAQLGWALYSGAAEALAYDTLADHRQEERFDEVISTSGTIAQFSSIVAILLGGVLYAIHFRLSHLAWSLTYFAGFIGSWWLVEPRLDTEKFSWMAYRKRLVDGTKQLFSPVLKPYLLMIFAVLGFEYMYEWGLVKPAMAADMGFLDQAQALIFALLGILSAILIQFIPRLRMMITDKKGLFVLTAAMASGFLLAYLPLGYWGIFPMLIISISGAMAYPWVSVVVNKDIDSKYRATTLSTVALITKIPYVLLAIVAGKMVEAGALNLFSLMVGGTMLITVIVSGMEKLKQIILSK